MKPATQNMGQQGLSGLSQTVTPSVWHVTDLWAYPWLRSQHTHPPGCMDLKMPGNISLQKKIRDSKNKKKQTSQWRSCSSGSSNSYNNNNSSKYKNKLTYIKVAVLKILR